MKIQKTVAFLTISALVCTALLSNMALAAESKSNSAFDRATTAAALILERG